MFLKSVVYIKTFIGVPSVRNSMLVSILLLLGNVLESCARKNAEGTSIMNATNQNLVFVTVVDDPTVILDPKTNLFFAYGSLDNWGDGKGSRLVQILESKDMVNWSCAGP